MMMKMVLLMMKSSAFGVLIPHIPLVCLLCTHERPLVKDMEILDEEFPNMCARKRSEWWLPFNLTYR